MASGAASGWSWLVQLLEDYGFDAHLVHPLASWAGLTPTVRGSNRTIRPGHISKQGPAWLRRFPALEDLPPLAVIKLIRPRRRAAAGAPA